ncbi:hypothetical protein R38712_01996 [Ralstonia pickettii]|jgi:hypothetical protein|uniref:Uncharacterized protein n=2 Tax=Ralstonia pickettii TaxID=329 RepID=A0ABN9HYG7_RALPI|nr:hypothetical protein R38712_01996 [Ralstonia pickettii]
MKAIDSRWDDHRGEDLRWMEFRFTKRSPAAKTMLP